MVCDELHGRPIPNGAAGGPLIEWDTERAEMTAELLDEIEVLDEY